jgi:glycine/D-amino acid oxidase-like deaminating enzyme/nitrite reductase/ring-hydroxylating ferredoxin subunit
VAVVGGGIAGLTAATQLAQAGARVAVLEMGQTLGAGDTGQTTAHVTVVPDAGFADITQKFGADAARKTAAAHVAALARIESWTTTFHIDCDFERVPFYLYATNDKEAAQLKDEREAMAKAGLDVHACPSVPLPFATQEGLVLNHQAQFHPLKYLAGLAPHIEQNGGVICTSTRVEQVTQEGQVHRLKTSRGELTARDVIFATHTPPNKLALQLKLIPQRTYAMSFRGQDLPPRGLFYDMVEPYHYMRRHPHDGGDVLIVGGCDHRSGAKIDTEQSYEALEAWARAHFNLTDKIAQWSGQVFEPVDGLPYIGANPGAEHSWVITGLSGNGMVAGTLGGMICADLALGQENDWAALFAPSRHKPVAQASALLKNAAEVTKHVVSDRLKAWLTSAPVTPHEGAVMRDGAHTVAAYHDGNALHVLSPVCPHSGCYVQFNRAEQGWDCPCHGSRFAGDGTLLAGPAMKNLSPMEP